MDPLRADDIASARKLTEGARLRLALEMMREGIAIQRANLRRRHPRASEAEIEVLLQRWMRRD